MIVSLQNQNKQLIEKLANKNTEHNKSLQESKAKLEVLKKQIEDLKDQSNIIDRKKAQQIEEELKKTIAANKVLNDDKVKLVQIIKDHRKNLMEKIGERMVSLSKLYYLKKQAKQAIILYDSQNTIQKLALESPRVKNEEMQSWLRVITEKDLATVTLRSKQTFLRRIKDVYDSKDLAFTLDLEKGQLKVEISFVNMFFNSLIQLKAPKLWEEYNVQSSAIDGWKILGHFQIKIQ